MVLSANLPIPRANPNWHVSMEGASGLAEPLAAALCAQWAFGFPRVPRPAAQLTHGFYQYPAGMQAVAAVNLLKTMPPGVLLDPFVGGGTTLIEGMRCGWKTIGADVSPLALFATTHHTWLMSEEELASMREQAVAIISAVDPSYDVQLARPTPGAGVDDVAGEVQALSPKPRLQRQAKHAGSRREGATTWRSWEPLRAELERVVAAADASVSGGGVLTTSSPTARSPLWFCYAAAQQRSARFRLASPLASFEHTVSSYIDAVCKLRRSVPDGAAEASLVLADARQLSLERLGLPLADAVVTSPPYAGVYDYLSHARQSRASLGVQGDAPLMGLTGTPEGRGDWPESWRSDLEIGARKALRKTRVKGAFAKAWERDQDAWLTSVRSNLRTGGRAALLVGDGESIDALVSTAAAAERVGLEFLASATISSKQVAGKKHKGNRRPEHVLLLRAP